MKFVLTKLSEPGWELEFDTYREAEDKLSMSCCWKCKEEALKEALDEIREGDGSCTLLEELLATPCGCEFYFEEIKE